MLYLLVGSNQLAVCMDIKETLASLSFSQNFAHKVTDACNMVASIPEAKCSPALLIFYLSFCVGEGEVKGLVTSIFMLLMLKNSQLMHPCQLVWLAIQ